MITDTLTKHKTPVVVTGVGLMAAFLLGAAPSMKSGAPPTGEIAAAFVAQEEQNSTQLKELVTRTLGIEANLEGRLGTIENQISILNKAVTRTSMRLKSQGDTIPANLEQRLGAIETQITTLNKAISKTFSRVDQNRQTANGLAEQVSGMSAHDVQIQTLNKAVTRLNLKIAQLEKSLAD